MPKLVIHYVKDHIDPSRGKWKTFVMGTHTQYDIVGSTAAEQKQNLRLLGRAMKEGVAKVDEVIPRVLVNVSDREAASVTSRLFGLSTELEVEETLLLTAARVAQRGGSILLDVLDLAGDLLLGFLI